ncbi:hypothetical protein [Aeromicrobium sp. REDSEA-S38_B2]|jgi:predicted ArsR family transcriptional regulator|uniref:hypothetical protein n=1 Tax=Aeromicrobium sp. REDSEA-S38_B2 TaxID=1811528 RepID=UPI000AEDEEFB|nr:hypothetical protein [Aeromicrobium sp. REDSEA-S38_B2]
MNQPAPTIWETLHKPVLQSVVGLINADRSDTGVQILEIMQDTDLPSDDVLAALRRLEDAGLVETRLVSPVHAGRVVAVSGGAQQLAEAWPSADSVADRLLAILEDLAEHGSDPVEKAKARKALDALGSLGRDLLVSVAGAAAGVAMQ